MDFSTPSLDLIKHDLNNAQVVNSDQILYNQIKGAGDSKAQLKKVTEIEDDYLLTIYLISAYNVFEVTRHMERSYMITNPDALIITAVEVQELLKTVKAYAKDVIIENAEIKAIDLENEKENNNGWINSY